MNVVHVTLLFLTVISSVLSNINISDDEYKLLPPIFHIDPYDKCLQENKKFCKVALKLTPLNSKNPSKIWYLIEETKNSKRHYNHDELFYAVCINNYYETNNTSITLNQIVSKFYTNKYKSIGLEAKVIKMNCRNYDHIYKTRLFDALLLVIIISYLLLIIIATLHDLKTFRSNQGNKYIVLLSVRHNLAKLRKTYQETKFQKLKCVQGIRFYTTVLIIFCHTFSSFAGGYIANTKYLEDLPENRYRHGLRTAFVFLVQTFFLISAWLLSYHTFQVFEQTKEINGFRYVWLTFLNRYLRIIPPVILMVSLSSSVWIYGYFRGPIKDIYSDKEYQRCQTNWWILLLFLNNHFNQYDMCYFTTWYLSADTQLYVLSLILLTIICKFQHNIISIMATCISVGILIPSIVSYIYNLDVIYRITPENSKNNKFLSFEFNATYSSTYSNMATYILGLVFGYVYFKFENKPLFTTKFLYVAWWTSFIGLPLIVIIISSYEYDRITSAILSGILRPTYALGIGIGIFGMSQQIGGMVKKFCEWKPALFLGNITYCTYVVHFGIVFNRTALASKPLEVSDYILFISFIQDAIFSFICGFLIYLLLEMPASQVQSIFVPKIRTYLKNNITGKKEK